MAKAHQEEHKHKRFYVFSHDAGQNILYRTSTGSWDDDFVKAMLWDGLDFATKKAIELEKQWASWANTGGQPTVRRFVVGSVKVEVDGFFAGHVVPSTVKR
jgi:hypothetical protein